MKEPSVIEIYNGRILDMRREGYTLQQIGDATGVTRERVRQILNKYFGGTKHDYLSEQEVARRIGCSYGPLERLRLEGLINPKRYGRFWLYDMDMVQKAQKILGVGQRGALITLICKICGKGFSLKGYIYNRRFHNEKRPRKLPFAFCSKVCYGKYFGRHHGKRR